MRVRCSSIRFGVAHKEMRRPALRQASVRFPSRHPFGVPSSERPWCLVKRAPTIANFDTQMLIVNALYTSQLKNINLKKERHGAIILIRSAVSLHYILEPELSAYTSCTY
jgi:hypothetical protein